MCVAQNLYVAGELLVDLVIPETVTEIPAYGLYNIKSIKSVTFHSGITTVHNHSFNSCTNIKEVYVPDIETYARVSAVNQSSTLDTIYVDGEPLVNLVVPEGTERLPAYCFKNYDKLESITIKSGLKYIGAGCFEGCDGLRDVYVDSIKNWLDISFDGSYANPMTVAENLYIAGENAENLVIDESVTAIPENAFANMTSIKTVTIHDKLTSIGKGAFENCTGIESVYAPSLEAWLAVDFASGTANPLDPGVKLYIDGELLEVLEIPENITTIKPYAFSGYSYFKKFNVTGAPLTIGNSAFSKDCAGMEIHAETLQDWFNVKADFSLFPGWCNPMKFGAVLYIGGKQPEEIVVPESIKSIPAFAFQNCKSLKKITIPATTTIGTDAFSGCSFDEIIYGSLTKKQEAVAEITSSPLNNTKIKKIVVGYGVKSVSKDAFKGETNLKEVVFLNGIEEIGDQAFYNTGIKTLTIPSTVKSIGKRAFTYSKSLESLTLGDKTGQPAVMNIDNAAFTYCSKLTKVTFNSGIKTMGEKVFYKSYEITDVYVNDLKAYLEMELPLYLGAGSESNPARFADNIYINGKIAKDVVIPEGVTRICAYAFSRCESIETVKFPSTLKYIDDGAFESCFNLKGLTLPDSLEVIGESAFFSCNSITSVNFGAKLKEIGFMAFENCTSLRIVYMYPEQLEISEDAFIRCNNIKLVLYSGSEEAWLKLLKANKNNTGLESVPVLYRFRPESMYAPAYLKATDNGTDSISLSWEKIDGVTGYRLYVKLDGKWKTVKTLKVNSYRVTGVEPGTKYTFAVKAYISSGAFVLWSPEYVTLSTATKALKPTGVTASQSTSAIKLTWNKVSGATGYRVYQKVDGKWKTLKSSTTATSYTIKDLKTGTKYTFAIKPYIKTDSGNVWSAYTQFTTATKPANPTAKVTAPSKGKLTVTWSAVKGAEAYQLWYKNGNGSYKLYKTYTGVKTLNFKNLKSGTKYTFAVRAVIKTSGGNVRSGYKTVSATVK